MALTKRQGDIINGTLSLVRIVAREDSEPIDKLRQVDDAIWSMFESLNMPLFNALADSYRQILDQQVWNGAESENGSGN